MLKLWKTPVLHNKVLLKSVKGKALASIQKFNFSGDGHGHGHSGSESDHEHGHHEEHHDHHEGKDIPIVSDAHFHEEARSRIFNHQEKFSVDNLLEQLKEPIVQIKAKLDPSQTQVYKSQDEYVNFLAKSFERQALIKYPEYKTHLDQFKHLIPNYDNLNAYQREAYTLDTYLHWKLELEELQIRESYNFSGTPLERARQRLNFFQNLTKEDHHHDTRHMHHLKEKLNKILATEADFEEFNQRYNESAEKQLVESIVEKRKSSVYFDIVENKAELHHDLYDLKAPGNKHRMDSHVTPHDHIHPQHFHKNPELINEEKWKYLAYFDIILDQHLRQVRPSSISPDEEMFKYVKDENKPLRNLENHLLDNMYYDYLYTLENEFYVKFKEEIKGVVGKMHKNEDVEDKSRPSGKHWKDEHKFPHVADRLGWDFLQETPWDKNPLFERVESHPAYQWQPFVQTPSIEPDKDLSLEEGETIYENKYVHEWVNFWRLLLYLSPLVLFLYMYESYNNNTAASPEYLRRFSLVHPFNSFHRGLPRRMPENVNYWGSNLWLWQHFVRKGLFYTVLIAAVLMGRKAIRIGNNYVIKAVYNREKDLVFIWRPTGIFTKEMHVYELHYLEQTVPRVTGGWEHLGYEKDGIFMVHDLRLNQELLFYNEKKYWNIDEREHFFKNTQTYWRGLRHKDVDRGIFFNRSSSMTEEEILTTKKINEEVKSAVEKHGPIFVTDYDFNYKYQLKKRVQEIKRNLIEGKPIDTSIYREKQNNQAHEEHNVHHALH